MANNHDYVALDWVRGEIEETLNQARQALEAFVGNTDDTARIRFCLNYIHQVHGTLQMVEFYGAALMAEEMEKLAQAMLNQEVPHPEEAQEVLMRAIVQLPTYLERIQTGKRDLPVILLPILNDLRASRGEDLLSDNSVFTPDLSPARVTPPPGVSQRLHDEETLALLRKLRQMYQFSLAGVIRVHDLEINYGFLRKVAKKLEQLCEGTAQGQLWSVARAYVEALAVDGIPLSSAAKNLLRHLDYQIKRLIDENIDILLQPVPEDLLKHLLYYIAKATAGSAHVDEIKNLFQLDRALPSEQEVDEERQKMSGPDRGAIHSVVAALNEELTRIKDQLDLFVRSELKNSEELEELIPGLTQVANTVAVMGLGIPRKVIQEQIDQIRAIVARDEKPDDGELMDIAGALLYVEATLSGMNDSSSQPEETTSSHIPREQLENAHGALIREARNGLEQAKNDIVEFIASHWDHREIADVPAMLNSIRGGLAIIPLERAAALLQSCARYVQEVLLDDQAVPEWQQLDTLADAITSIEYYLERLSEGSKDNEMILQVAEESVASLGYAVGQTPQRVARTTPVADSDSTAVPSNVAPDASANKATDRELIDEEIIDIFVEEADEVLQTIGTYFPQFQAEPKDQAALVELRRAFHTLKGSGRLVGASTLAELAWSVENMLNRVLDGSIDASLGMFELLDSVISRLPRLLAEFRSGEQSEDVSDFMAQAEALAQPAKTSARAAASVSTRVDADEPEIAEAAPAESSDAPDSLELDEVPELTDTVDAAQEPATIDTLASVEAEDQGDDLEEADADLVDDEILEIFIEEAGEVLDTIRQYLPQYLNDTNQHEALIEARRAFHTLKGSGRMVGALRVGETAWGIENLMNRIIDNTVSLTPDAAELMRAVVDILPELIDDFRLRRRPSRKVEPYQQQAQALARGEAVPPLATVLGGATDTVKAADTAKADTTTSQEMDVPTLHTAVSTPEANVASLTDDLDEDVADYADEGDVDPVLLDIFRTETETHLQTLESFVANARASGQPVPLSDDVSRALHTLKGSANTANILPIATVAVPMEKYIKEARACNVLADQSLVDLLAELVGFIHDGIVQLEKAPQAPLDGVEEYLQRVTQAHQAMLQHHGEQLEDSLEGAPDPQLINIFLTEGVDILLDAEQILLHWSHNPVTGDELEKLSQSLLTLNQGACIAGLDDVAELSDALREAYGHIDAGSLVADDASLSTIRRGHEVLLNMMDQVAAGLSTQRDAALLQQLQELATPALPDEDAIPVLQDDLPETLEVSFEHTETDEPEAIELADLALPDEAESIELDAEDSLELTEEDLPVLETPSSDEELSFDEALSFDEENASLEEIPALEELASDEELVSTEELAVADDSVEAEEFAIADAVTADAEDDLIELDPELAEIFLEEAQELIDSTGETLHAWKNAPSNLDLVAQLQRDLHTLKGGARLAQIRPMGDLAHEMESLFERLAEGRISLQGNTLDLVLQAHDALAGMVDSVIRESRCPSAPGLITALQAAASAALGDEDIEVPAIPTLDAPVDEVPESVAEQASDELLAAEAETITEIDPELAEIFLEEAQDIIDSTATNLHDWLQGGQDMQAMKELQRDVHTLKGGARLADVRAIGDLAHELENLFEGIVDGRFQINPSLSDLLLQCHDRLATMVDAVRDGQPLASAPDLIAAIHAYCKAQRKDGSSVSSQPVTTPTKAALVNDDVPTLDEQETGFEEITGDEDLVAIFLDEAQDLLQSASDSYQQWRANPLDPAHLVSLTRDLHTLKGGARLAALNTIGDVADKLYDCLAPLTEMQGEVTEDLISLTGEAISALNELLEQLAKGEPMHASVALLARLSGTAPQPGAAEQDEADDSVADDVRRQTDPEILQIFLEEARELGQVLETSLADWHKEPGNLAHAQAMQHALHTLKGGARLADLHQLGDLSQSLESLVKQAMESGQRLEGDLQQSIRSRYDSLQRAIGLVRAKFRELEIQGLNAGATQDLEAEPTARVVEFQRQQIQKPTAAPAEPPHRAQAPQTRAATPQQQVETIRVSAPLLDNLVNLAGETSIARGRLEQQISDFSHTLDEMGATVDRLREQLRRMEMETEAQVLFRQERQSGPEYADFDPLEMDRYSTVQQLSRALGESASDLMDLKDTMTDKVRDAETLLLQQSRINTELQEGLMKTRMVPFSSMVPRLRRIVRQVAGELGKKVDFEVYNPDGELDRNVLERMVAPLEHMLRNAIDHGIESIDARRKAGKSETGQVTLSLSREGGDVVLVMADDGAGVNVAAVRKKALAQGLLEADADVTDQEVMQFIMQPGFSTAQQVTQISGRGVGMDVVASEIKQLGGRIMIESLPGQGTRFIVHLPFTVSVNRALMVSTGEDFYAIPLNTIEGIVRVSTYELEQYYQPDAPLYEYAGQRYRLQYLGSLLRSEHQPKLQGQPLPLPVILVRGGDQPLALQVDSLMGSREIVVKSLGPQFAQVRGASGATILGDGSVVVILDLPAMLRADFTTQLAKQPVADAAPSRSTRTKLVMVVDDSVTVRKVTSRLLERNGMEVITAKDGVDAIALLQDRKPDIMLLDIEMPRMDGFEVASLVRHDERLKDVPIIMITSRTGQKHRDRAMAIGVNEYLGKPFQETVLLETIEKLTG